MGTKYPESQYFFLSHVFFFIGLEGKLNTFDHLTGESNTIICLFALYSLACLTPLLFLAGSSLYEFSLFSSTQLGGYFAFLAGLLYPFLQEIWATYSI